MNTEALFLFVILLLGLVLCSFLGGNCNKEGLTNNPVVYNGPDGASATIITNSDGTQSIQLNQTSGSQTVIFKQSSTTPGLFTNPFSHITVTISNGNIVFKLPTGETETFTPSTSTSTSSSTSSTTGEAPATSSTSSYDNYNHYSGSSSQLVNGSTFYGPNGGTVVVTPGGDGTQTLQVTLISGQQPMTFQQNTQSSSVSGSNGSITTFYGPNGNSATIINTNNGQQAVQVQTPSGNYTFSQSGAYYNPDDTTSTQYYGSTGYPIQTSGYSQSYQGTYGVSAGAVTGPQGNTAYYAQGPNGNTVAGTSTNYSPYYNAYQGPYGGSNSNQGTNGNTYSGSGYGTDYYSTMPQGVTKSQIPAGQEDLYILKSEIVPPVCPACPSSAACPRQEKCPPCPACARCPEPAFECKKVPNYSAIDNDYLPQPVLSDFSQFGM